MSGANLESQTVSIPVTSPRVFPRRLGGVVTPWRRFPRGRFVRTGRRTRRSALDTRPREVRRWPPAARTNGCWPPRAWTVRSARHPPSPHAGFNPNARTAWIRPRRADPSERDARASGRSARAVADRPAAMVPRRRAMVASVRVRHPRARRPTRGRIPRTGVIFAPVARRPRRARDRPANRAPRAANARARRSAPPSRSPRASLRRVLPRAPARPPPASPRPAAHPTPVSHPKPPIPLRSRRRRA